MVGGPLPGALATVDVSRDEPNTGAELSQESRTTYVTIVHRCSVSGEPPVLCSTSTDVYRFRPLCCCLLGLLQRTRRLRSSTGGRRAVYRTNIEQRALRPLYVRNVGASGYVYVVRAAKQLAAYVGLSVGGTTKVDVEGSWPAVRPAGLHPVATRWHLSIEHPSFPRAHHSRRPSFDGGR